MGRERHAAVDDRAVQGHWEGTCWLVRLRGKDTATVVQALARRVQTLPGGLMASLTWDRRLELAAHHAFTVATDVQVYFCDPHSPWQRRLARYVCYSASQ